MRKTKIRVIVGALCLLLAIYAVGGFVVAPRLLRSALIDNVRAGLGVTPAVGEIRVNPFLFRVEIKDFSLPDAAGEPLVGFRSLFVDFDLSSIWRRAYVFAAIKIAAPYVHAVVAVDGRVNLLQLQLKSKPTAPQPAAPAAPLPRLRIGEFSVTDGLATYEDRSRPSHFATRLNPINFDLRDFSTGSEGGRFTFTGTSRLGERLEWRGHLSVQPIESDGELRIDALRAHTIWEYFEDRLAFAVDTGSIDVSAAYRFALKDAIDLNVDVTKLAVTQLAIRPKESKVNWIELPAFDVSGASVDLVKHEVKIGAVALKGLKLDAWLEPDKRLNLLQLAEPPVAGAATAATTTPAAPPAGRPWRVDLHEFSIQDASISAEDRGTQPVASLLLAPFSLKVTGASSDLTRPVDVALTAKVNGSGDLAIDGQVTPAPLAANLRFKLNGLELAAAQPYIQQHTSMTLLGGRFSGEAVLRYGRTKPALALAGNFSIRNLHTIDNRLRDDFVNWDRLDVLGLKYSQGPDRLEIQKIVARKPYARVIVETDSSLNVTRVLSGPKPDAANAAQPQLAAAPMSVKRSGPVAKAQAQAQALPPPPAMAMAIGNVTVQSGQVNFTDLSVLPNFGAGIQALNGTVRGLSSKPNSRAKVDLHGQTDPFAPVSITGEVNVLGAALYTDIAMSFRNMELTTFNPYSGKFAGYNITKGKLSTEFHYKVENRKLDAQHHVTIDQLEFGEKTASKDAVSLPVKLAVALLKDRNGVIDIDLPVTGSLDDPQFRLGPLIWKVVVNLLVKAVTAPFALLGSLFGGGPEMQFVDFQPGAATLDAAATDKLKAVAKALAERPQLKIELPIAPLAEVDRPALVEAQYLADVRAQIKPVAAAVSFEQLDPGKKLALLTSIYKKNLGAAPSWPAGDPAAKPAADATAAKIEYLIHEIKGHIVVGDAELKSVADLRANAMQQALLTGTQVAPERVFLVANGKAKAENGLARLELTLQ